MRKLSLLLIGLASAAAFAAAPPKTWDAIFGAAGEGDYSSAKIVNDIRFTKYELYGEKQQLTFKVKSDNFEFMVAGDVLVSKDVIDQGFYASCNQTKEVWVSYFNRPKNFKKQTLIVEVKGVDLACGDDLYAIHNLKLKFPNPEAQEWWKLTFEHREKRDRDELARFRQDEQDKRSLIRTKSEMITDPRDGQQYRVIDIDGRRWFAQNVNFKVDGESWCYEDQESYCTRSGRLYIFEGARKACPVGWHLPRDREWTDMLTGLTKCYDGVQKCGAFAAKMKATTGWQGGGGTDEYGFTVFSSGYRKKIGKTIVKYEDMGEYAGFWSAQNGRNETLWLWSMGRMSDQMVRQLVQNKENAYSVRCVEGD